jgi:hypothetical protein
VLPVGAGEDKSLDVDIDTEQFLRDHEVEHGWADTKVSSPADHVAILEQHLVRARDLQLPLQSARNYEGSARRVFVLVQHGEHVTPLVYDIDRSALETRTDLEAVDLIACGPNEKLALVAGSEIERWANVAVRSWCERNEVDTDSVRKVCSMYLQPQRLSGGVDLLLDARPRNN